MAEKKPVMAVLGAGTMGSGIAIVCARAGFKTFLVDNQAACLEKGADLIGRFFDKSVQKGKLSAEERNQIMHQRLVPTQNLADLAECGLVIEAVFEDLEIKKKLLAQVNQICPPETILASNTSTLSITSLAAGSGRPDRVIGMHFCLPAQVMKLVEVTRGLQTSEETYARAMELGKALGQKLVTTKDTPGFILNYFVVAFNNACIRAYEQGLASVEDIDKAVKLGLGYPMGPFELLDYIGMDTHLRVSLALYNQVQDERFWPPALVQRMVDAGYLGRKTGRGFHQYKEAGMFGA
ncbi:MAG: 3-hydroxyacyl-CoA dehydrogenase family protein [Thermodesulfobacteriota bacterium]